MDVNVNLYLRCEGRSVHLSRYVKFVFRPRQGEWVKIVNAEHGNYFALLVREVRHIEGAAMEIHLEPDDIEPVEFDEYIASYRAEGWQVKGG